MSILCRFDYDTADDFLHALMPSSEIWNPGRLNQFIFRGQADAEWKLIPSALRHPEKDNAKQRQVELNGLRSFWIEADRQGLLIPGNHFEVRELWISPTAPAILGKEILQMAGRDNWAKIIQAWPPKELWEPLALAQHYGVPTRLLDWSRLPMVAAYFAALGATGVFESDIQTDSRLAVWACHENILSVSKWLDESLQFVHLVDVARGGNPNLHAQHGTFTLITPNGLLVDPLENAEVSIMSLDQALNTVLNICNRVDNMFTFLARAVSPPLRLLTLPISQAARLLEYLDMLGFSGATLRPGFYGAAQAASEKLLRDRLLK